MTLPKWLCSLASSLLLVVAWSLSRFFRMHAPFLRADGFFVVATLVCALESLLFLAQQLSIVPKVGMATAGSFDNIAGFASCLALSLPLGISKMKSQRPVVKWLLIVAKMLCVVGIVCSGSRMGMLCLGAMVMIYLKVKKGMVVARPMRCLVAAGDWLQTQLIHRTLVYLRALHRDDGVEACDWMGL